MGWRRRAKHARGRRARAPGPARPAAVAGVDQREPGVALQKRRDDRLRSPRARSSRWRRPAARRRDHRRGVLQHPRSCAAASAGQIVLAPPPADVGIAADACRGPSRARRRSTQIERARRTAAAAPASALHQAHAARAAARDGAAEQLDAPRPHVGGDEQPSPVHGRRHRRRLAARRRAAVEHALARAARREQRTSCDASSWTTNSPVAGERRPQRIARRHDETRRARTRAAWCTTLGAAS